MTERPHKTIVALFSAALMISLGVVSQEEAFYSHEFGVDYNVMIVDITRKAGYRITFWQFFKFGFPVMVSSVALSVLYLWLVWGLWLALNQIERSLTHHPNVQRVHLGEHADALHRCDGSMQGERLTD